MTEPRLARFAGVSVTQADGWFAVHFIQSEPYYYLDRIACWVGTVKDEGFQAVVDGYGARDFLAPAGDVRDFYVFVHEKDVDDECRRHWTEESHRYFERNEQIRASLARNQPA